MRSERSTDITQSERFRSRYFDSVVTACRECRDRSPLVAVRYDETQPPNPRLSPQDIEFIVDVEKASHAALDGVNLFPVWEAMLHGETVPMNRRAQVTDRCARVYIRRDLLPFEYFRPKRLRIHRPEQRTAA